ncbi:MAG: aspartyl protease family protein [Bacteroidota bacterium]
MRYKIPVQIIELESENYHVLVSSAFFDGTKGNWVIDTGASKSVFDKNMVNYYSVFEDETEELHSAGLDQEPLTTIIGYMKTFSLGKMKIENMKIALLDLSHINELYSKATDLKICGLIGSDFLVKHGAVIDYRKGILKL